MTAPLKPPGEGNPKWFIQAFAMRVEQREMYRQATAAARELRLHDFAEALQYELDTITDTSAQANKILSESERPA